jgi:hypothetical protein
MLSKQSFSHPKHSGNDPKQRSHKTKRHAGLSIKQRIDVKNQTADLQGPSQDQEIQNGTDKKH